MVGLRAAFSAIPNLNWGSLARKAEMHASWAEQARSPALKYAAALCREIGVPESSIQMGPTKEVPRIIEKALARYEGRIEKVQDICRLKIFIETADDVILLRKLFGPAKTNAFANDWHDRGISLIEVKDNFWNPTETGWMGFNNKYEVDIGKGRTQGIEIQIVPRGMEDIYATTHLYLEHKREIADLAKAQHRRLSENEARIINDLERAAIDLHLRGAQSLGFLRLIAPERQQILTHNAAPVFA